MPTLLPSYQCRVGEGGVISLKVYCDQAVGGRAWLTDRLLFCCVGVHKTAKQRSEGCAAAVFHQQARNPGALEVYTLQANVSRVDVPEDKIATKDGDDTAVYSDDKLRVIAYPKVEVGSRLVVNARAVEPIGLTWDHKPRGKDRQPLYAAQTRTFDEFHLLSSCTATPPLDRLFVFVYLLPLPLAPGAGFPIHVR